MADTMQSEFESQSDNEEYSIDSEYNELANIDENLSENEDFYIEGNSDTEEEDFTDTFSDVNASNDQTFSQKKIVELIALKNNLKDIDNRVMECNLALNKSREEVLKCQENIVRLRGLLSSTESQLQAAIQENHVTNTVRIRQACEKLEIEITAEKSLEDKLIENISVKEIELTQLELEQSKFMFVREEVALLSKRYDRVKREAARIRLRKEHLFANHFESREKRQAVRNENLQREKQRIHQERIDNAKDSHLKARIFFKKTLRDIKEKQRHLENEERENFQKRMNTVLDMKINVSKNKENLKVQQARNLARLAQCKAEREAEQQRLEEAGKNAAAIMLQKKRLAEFEKEKQNRIKVSKKNEVEIFKKILKEERSMEQRFKNQPWLKDGYSFTSSPKKTIINPIEHSIDKPVEETAMPYNRGTSSMSSINTNFAEDNILENDSEVEDELIVPEFKGLWDTSSKDLAVDTVEKYSFKTKYEKEMFEKQLNTLQNNIVQKQIAAGKEFKGRPFMSKPEIIHFKDFSVGKTYRRNVTLTNVSYSINYCRLISLSDHLKDFITLEFTSPGQMSAGMTCDLLVTFTPKINENLNGKIDFLSKIGPFDIPIKCTIKKCDMSINVAVIDFGTQVIGETLSKCFILENKGALGTNYECRKKVNDIKNNADIIENENVEAIDPDIDGISLGLNQSGFIEPFSHKKIELVYQPSIPCTSSVEFEICFPNDDLEHIEFRAIAQSIDVPVWVERKTVDLKICMYNRLYQDSIVVFNRAKTALGLRFEVNTNLRNHIELLPKTAYIQAQSSFQAQLKFLPQSNLIDDAGDLFDEKTGLLEVPCVIKVAEQVTPVTFSVMAIVTTSDLKFEIENVNFGCASIYENVIFPIKLKNLSLLPQQYGFVKIPEFIDVQPNDGFGTILPLETIIVDLIFMPKKAKKYEFTLVCKSGINRDFPLYCKGVGVLPPLELSDNIINFPATALEDISYGKFYLVNSHVSKNEFTHPVPRIGTGEIAPVGPTSFEFCVDPRSCINIWPAVGTVMPGEKKLISISYSPIISNDAIKEEALRISLLKFNSDNESEKYLKEVSKSTEEDKKKRLKKASVSVKDDVNNIASSEIVPNGAVELPSIEDICEDSEEFKTAKANLIKNFTGEFSSYSIPCYIASGKLTNPGELKYSIYNTLFLDVHTPSTPPKLIIISNNGSSHINFEKVAIGQKIRKNIIVHNPSPELTLFPKASPLDSCGIFELRNALRPIAPNAMHTLIVSFTPLFPKTYRDILTLDLDGSSFHLILEGICIEPKVTLIDVVNDEIDCGYVQVGDNIQTVFKIKNESELAVPFAITPSSLDYVNRSNNGTDGMSKNLFSSNVGTQNQSGLVVFDCSPQNGTISPFQTVDVTVSFNPDHESFHFQDIFELALFNQTYKRILTKGIGCKHSIFLDKCDVLKPSYESLVIQCIEKDDKDEDANVGKNPNVQSVLLTFESTYDSQKDMYRLCTREVVVGTVRSSQFAQKKSGEYSVEITQTAAQQGFSTDQLKGSLEPGSVKTVPITWTPPIGHDPNALLDGLIKMTLRGDSTCVYEIMCKALVVTPE